MGKDTRKRYGAEFRAKVALEAIFEAISGKRNHESLPKLLAESAQ